MSGADAGLPVVSVPATSANLGPGFDAFGLALSLRLTVAAVARTDRRVASDGDGADELPTGDDNLIWRSLLRFCETFSVPAPDVSLRVRCEIPLERGLGSSSAAIIAGLAMGRALTEVRCGDGDLVALATELEGHPDNVAPAVLGGLVACAPSDGGPPVVRRVNPAPDLACVALVPDDRQLTTEARAVLPESLPRGKVITQAARAGHVIGALTGQWPADPRGAADVLHEPVRLPTMPVAADAIKALRAEGLHAWLSGAGPSVLVGLRGPQGQQRETVTATAAARGMRAVPLTVDLAGVVACPPGGCAFAPTPTCAACPRAGV